MTHSRMKIKTWLLEGDDNLMRWLIRKMEESGGPLKKGSKIMKILGPFLVASGQRTFIIVATDYFTKWINARGTP